MVVHLTGFNEHLLYYKHPNEVSMNLHLDSTLGTVH